MLSECKICHQPIDGKTLAKLITHIGTIHLINYEEYVILTEYNSIAPKCMCGVCNERPFFNRGKYSKYALDHENFKVRESLYIEKYGSPKCLHCGGGVDFYRGEPRQFCSHVCSGLHSGGFNKKETQDKIKKVIIEKYGVDNISKLDSIKEKISEQNTGNNGWKHSPKTLEKISKSSKLAWKDNVNRRSAFSSIMHNVRIRNWQDPVYRKTILQGNLSGKHSKLHQYISSNLGLKNLGFEDEKVIFRYRVDEINFEKKIIVEINGDYVHANPAKYKADDLIIVRSSQYLAKDKWIYDQKRREALEALGFKMFVVWQSDDLDKKKIELYQLLGIDV